MCEADIRHIDHGPVAWLTEPQHRGPGRRIDRFLESLRDELRGLEGAEIDDIVQELRSHLLDQLGVRSEAAAVAALGAPAELAALYLDERTAAQAIPHTGVAGA